jgi:hypothetical protein
LAIRQAVDLRQRFDGEQPLAYRLLHRRVGCRQFGHLHLCVRRLRQSRCVVAQNRVEPAPQVLYLGPALKGIQHAQERLLNHILGVSVRA